MNNKFDELAKRLARSVTWQRWCKVPAVIGCLLSLDCLAQPTGCVLPPPGLMGWWPGDGNANDILGSNNGVLSNGAVATAQGLVGQAFGFNGVSSYVLLPNLLAGQSEGTVECWVNLNSWNWTSGPCGVFLWSSTLNLPSPGPATDGINLGCHHGYTGIGELMFGVWETGATLWHWAHSGVIPQTNTWYHVAGTWGPGGVCIYINGVLSGSEPYTGPAPSYLQYNLLGCSAWPSTFTDGRIDEFSLYSRALSPAEIAAIYAAGSAGKCKPLSVLADSFTLVAETCTNNAIDPGERVTVSIGLRNGGSVDTTNLIATLQAGGGVTAPTGPQAYGALTAGGPAVTRSFTFTGSGSCGNTSTATLQLQEGTNDLGTVTFTFMLGQTSTTTNFFENFDSVIPPNLPTGWAAWAAGFESPWATATAASDTAPNSVFAPDVPDIGLSELDSPAISLPPSPSRLSFRNYYNLEWSGTVGYDGGVLEININGGGWSDILDAGGSFSSGGYIAPISTAYGNPLAGRSAWTGNSGGFINTVVNLPDAAAGQSIQLRWLCGTDNSFNWLGWYVDTIAITMTTPVCCTPPPIFTGATSSGNVLNLSWSALPGRSYQLLYTTDLAQPNWIAFTTITANDFTATATDSIGPELQRFYRVALLP